MRKKTFASDNYSGVHPAIMDALSKANEGHAPSYGADEFTAAAIQKFKDLFGDDIDVFLVYNGTGANVLGLQLLTQSFHSILCAELAHINVDESTAPEKFLGCKIIPIATSDGKLTPAAVEAKIQRLDDQHHPQAKVISVSQSTEYGTVYTVDELKALSALAKKYNLYFHMDGSRISNAAVSLDAPFEVFTKDAGVDVLSFGGTKNGMMFGEAVIVFNQNLGQNLKYFRKQGMQLHSKMRYIGAQFNALLNNDLWKQNAAHANKMARLLEQELLQIREIKITQSVDANAVFAIFPEKIIPQLQQEHFFYVWAERTSEVRLMSAFDTTEAEIKNFAKRLKALVASA